MNFVFPSLGCRSLNNNFTTRNFLNETFYVSLYVFIYVSLYVFIYQELK